MPDLATVPGVELARVGHWDCSTGPWDVTPGDIADAVRAATDGSLRIPVVKLGHTDPRFDGQPAVGQVRNLRASADGQSLLGDLTGVPQWLADVLPSAFPSRSVEGIRNVVTASGQRYGFALTGLALLGVTTPAIQSLADIRQLYDVAASGEAVVYDLPVMGVLTAAAAAPDPSPAPAAEAQAASGGPTKEEGLVPDTNLRDLLRPHVGFAEDADDLTIADAIKQALAERAETPPAPAPVVVSEVPEAIAAAAAKTSLLEQEVRTLSGQLAEIRASAQADTKTRFFRDEALGKGRITPAERAHYEQLWDLDPAVTERIVLARAEYSAVAVAELGHGTDAPATADDGWFPQYAGSGATTTQEG